MQLVGLGEGADQPGPHHPGQPLRSDCDPIGGPT
jgi:hypothetical protein